MSDKLREFDIVEILANPGFSTVDRTGEKAIVLVMNKDFYVKDKRGTAWPLDPLRVKKVDRLVL